MKESTFQNFMKRLPKGAEVVAENKNFYYNGQILDYDETHFLIADGESMQLIRI